MAVVVAPDGTRWRVGRRWLPWEPRRRSARGFDVLDAAGGADDIFLGLVFLVLALALNAALALLLPLAFLLGELLLLALAVPALACYRTLARRPWPVIARPEGGRALLGDAPTYQLAGELADQVRSEIETTGHPRGLSPEPDLLADLLDVSPTTTPPAHPAPPPASPAPSPATWPPAPPGPHSAGARGR